MSAAALASRAGAPVAHVADRDRGIDALRVGLTVLVIFHHAAITYGAPGDWFYRELRPSASVSGALLTLFVAFNQAWFMGLFFLLAGLFTPGSIARRGPAAYACERLLRLGVPLLAFGLLVGPATIALAGTVQGRPFWPGLTQIWSRGTVEVGPLWFAEALLLFAACALACFLASRPTGRPQSASFPSDLVLLATALGTATAAFALRLVWPVGRQVGGLQLGYFASYALLFAAGCLGARPGWWRTIPERQARRWLLVAALTVPILPLTLVAGPTIGLALGPTEGGWTLGAAAYALWEPLVAWGTILGLLAFASRVEARLPPAWSRLGRASYSAFILHAPLLVAVALALRSVHAPPLIKVMLAGTAASLLTFAGALALLRVPVLRRVL